MIQLRRSGYAWSYAGLWRRFPTYFCIHYNWPETQTDMSFAGHHAYEHDIRTPLCIHYGPFFEIIVYGITPRKIKDLKETLSVLFPSLPSHSFVPPRYPGDHVRSRSCRPALDVEQRDIFPKAPEKTRLRHQEDRQAILL